MGRLKTPVVYCEFSKKKMLQHMRKSMLGRKTAPFKGARCIWGQQLAFYHKLTSELCISFLMFYSMVDIGGSAISKNQTTDKTGCFQFQFVNYCLGEG